MVSSAELVFTEHASYQREHRQIPIDWIAETINSPDQTEQRGDGKRSFLKCYQERGKMLRVVTRSDNHSFIITAYFDRRMPC